MLNNAKTLSILKHPFTGLDFLGGPVVKSL